VADETVRVVFDCNLFVQAFLTPKGAAGQCLELVRRGRVELFISAETLLEVNEVLLRPRLLSFLPHAKPELTEMFLEDIVAMATIVRVVPNKFRFERDPKDAPYLNLAIAADADYLVSRDRDLLDLMTAHSAECKEFRQRFRKLKIIVPENFMQAVEESAS
jgi:uncharacterized protein